MTQLTTYGGVLDVGTTFNGLSTGSSWVRTLSAAGHYGGGQFIAPKTGIIDTIRYRTGTATSALLELEGVIVNLDSSGLPSTDITVSSTTTTNPASASNYSLSISASVTAGTMYGVLVRVKAYTSGTISINVHADTHAQWGTGANNEPCAFYNVATPTKNAGLSYVNPVYSTGDITIPGIQPIFTGSDLTITATSGNVAGNKFTLDRPKTLIGYWAIVDTDNPCNLELYSGSDNTAYSNSSVTVQNTYRAQNNSTSSTIGYLTDGILLNPGTYRIGLRNTSAASNIIRQGDFFSTGAKAGAAGWENYQKTVYASGAWTDTAASICAVLPIWSALPDDGVIFLGGSSL